MSVSTPVEQLHGLLHEQKKVATKIAEVESALNFIKKNVSASLAQRCIDGARDGLELKEDLMKEEQTYERLLQALREMQTEIAERVRPVAEQVVRSEVDRLREQSEQHKNTLAECLTNIDQSILKCRSHMTEYHQTRSDLKGVNERLASLGAEPILVPDFLPTENLGDLITARVAELRAEGKI